MSAPAGASMVDLDAFLTQIESKLRAPFSSLELGKASEQKDAYLSNLLKVLPRAEKVTQLRALIGLLAWEPSETFDPVLRKIVEAAQVAPVYEEWVRVIAEIVQDILFEEHLVGGGHGGNESNLGKTCMEILDQLRSVALAQPRADDVDPLFVPFRFHLLPPDLLQSVLPESCSHDHFQINETADILQMDAKLELEKAKEEADHSQQRVAGSAVAANSKATGVGNPNSTSGSTATASSAPRKPAVARPKSSMFLPSKPRTAPLAVKATGLHQRKAALSLVLKGRRGGGGRSTNATAPAAVDVRGKSKMKMLDVAEVQGLEQSKNLEAAAEASSAGRGRKATQLAGKKRPHPDGNRALTESAPPAAKAPLKTAETVVMPLVEPAAGTGDLASAALLAYQSQQKAAAVPTPRREKTKQQDWRDLLQQRSNRLSEEDRRRVQQFFVDHYNPTPELATYKMKVHEERTTDPKTGKAMKETYYLELDYGTFTSTQTKKVKRYEDDV